MSKEAKLRFFSVVIKMAECWRIVAFKLWCWRRLLRVPWTVRRSNQSILKEINPEYSLEGLMLKLKLQYFGHLMWRTDSCEKILMLVNIKGKMRSGQQRMRWLDGITTRLSDFTFTFFLFWLPIEQFIFIKASILANYFLIEQYQFNSAAPSCPPIIIRFISSLILGYFWIMLYTLMKMLNHCHIWVFVPVIYYIYYIHIIYTM